MLKPAFGRYEDLAKDRNTRNHRNSNGVTRGRSRHKNNSKIVGHMEERNVGTIIKEESPKQDITSTIWT